jgi:hypothetical protein
VTSAASRSTRTIALEIGPFVAVAAGLYRTEFLRLIDLNRR